MDHADPHPLPTRAQLVSLAAQARHLSDPSCEVGRSRCRRSPLPLAARVQRVLLLARATFRLPGHLAQPNRGHPGPLPGGRSEPEASLWYGFVLTALAARAACRNRGTAARSRERVTGIPIDHPRTSALRAMTASSASSPKSAMPSLPSCVSEPDDLTQRCGLACGSELDLRLYGAS
jgi:hypothetical protein